MRRARGEAWSAGSAGAWAGRSVALGAARLVFARCSRRLGGPDCLPPAPRTTQCVRTLARAAVGVRSSHAAATRHRAPPTCALRARAGGVASHVRMLSWRARPPVRATPGRHVAVAERGSARTRGKRASDVARRRCRIFYASGDQGKAWTSAWRAHTAQLEPGSGQEASSLCRATLVTGTQSKVGG